MRCVVHIDDWRSHVGRRRIGIKADGGALIRGVRVSREGLLGGGEGLLFGCRKLESYFPGLRKPCAIGDNLRVEAEIAILVAQPFGDAGDGVEET